MFRKGAKGERERKKKNTHKKRASGLSPEKPLDL